MGLAVLLGAGFSKWAAELPLASELFDFRIAVDGVRENRKLDEIRQLKFYWNEKHPAGGAEQFIRDCVDASPHRRDLVVWYIARRLSEPFIWREWHAGRQRRHVLSIDERRKVERPGYYNARSFLDVVSQRHISVILTTNYDLLVEYALGTRAFHFGVRGQHLAGRGPYPVSTYAKPVAVTGGVFLAKLHGSLAMSRLGRFTTGKGGLTGDVLVVPPAQGKAPAEILNSLWTAAGRAFEASEQLVVFGFAFNAYDTQILDLLAQRGGRIRRVLLIDPAPNIETAKRLWPSALIQSVSPLPTLNLDEVAEFVRTE